MAGSPYKLIGKLPPRVGFSSRYKVLHRPMERHVEFRFPREGDPEQGRRYLQELDELSRLDHPCFLPLLDKGTLKGRACYVVPFRQHRTIPQLVAAKEFFLGQAIACIRSLSTALAAAHEAGFLLGPISPRQVAWNDVAATAYFLHHRVGTPAYLRSEALELPLDIAPEVPPTRQADLFHWGFFAYFLLSQGSLPYANGSRTLVPLSEACPYLPRSLAVAVEAALSRAPSERPESGIELGKVLQIEDANLPQIAPEPPPAPGGPPLAASERFQALADGYEQLHLSTGYWLPKDFGQREEAPSLQEAPAPAEEEGPDLDLFQSSRTGSVQSLPPRVPIREDSGEREPRDRRGPSGGTEAPESSGPRAEPPDAPEARGLPRAAAPVAGLLLLLVGLGTFLAPEAPETATASAPAPAPSAPLLPSGELRPLPEAEARRFQQDPQIRELLLLRRVPGRSFSRVFQRVESLLGQDRLPACLRDPERLQGIQTVYQEYPDQACRELLGFLDDLRLVLGEAEAR